MFGFNMLFTSLLVPLSNAALPEDIAIFKRVFGCPANLVILKSFPAITFLPDEPCWSNPACDYDRFFTGQHGSVALSEAHRIHKKFGKAWDDGSAEYFFNLLLRVGMDNLSDELFLRLLEEFKFKVGAGSATFLLELISLIKFRQMAPFCSKGSLTVVINALIGFCLHQTVPNFWISLPERTHIPIFLVTDAKDAKHWSERPFAVYEHKGGVDMGLIGNFEGISDYLATLEAEEEECPINFFDDFTAKLKFFREARDHYREFTMASEDWFKRAAAISQVSPSLRSVVNLYAFRLPSPIPKVFSLILDNPQLTRYFCEIFGYGEHCRNIHLLSSFVPKKAYQCPEEEMVVLEKVIAIYPEVRVLDAKLASHVSAIKKCKLNEEVEIMLKQLPNFTFDFMAKGIYEGRDLAAIMLKFEALRAMVTSLDDEAKNMAPLIAILRILQYLGMPVNDERVEVLLKGNENEPFAFISLNEPERKELMRKYDNQLSWWHQRSRLLSQIPLEILFLSVEDSSIALSIKTLLYLEGEDNPFMNVTRDQLLPEMLSFTPTQQHLLHWFGDAIVKFVGYEVASGGLAVNSSAYVIGSLLKLKSDRPADCPIEPDEINKLMDLLIGYNASSIFHNSNVLNKHLITTMKIGDRIFLSVRNRIHAVAVEVIRQRKDSYLVTLLNSGLGLETHHAKDPNENRWIYYQGYRLTKKQIEERNYFNDFDSEKMDKIYGIDGKLPSSTDFENDGIVSQKSGTCYIKSTRFLLKWFLSIGADNSPRDYSRYYWWKTWVFTTNSSIIYSRLCNIPVQLASQSEWNRLTTHWGLTKDISLTPAVSASAAIMWHQTMRLLGEAKKPKNAVVRDSMIRMLDSMDMFSHLRKAFDLNKP